MDVAAGVTLLVLAAVALAVAIRFRRRPVSPVAPERSEILEREPVTVPDEIAAPPAPAIRWTAQLTAATLDEAARLRLIDDLALLGAAWAVALLRLAHDEEQAPHLRARIEAALDSGSKKTLRA